MRKCSSDVSGCPCWAQPHRTQEAACHSAGSPVDAAFQICAVQADACTRIQALRRRLRPAEQGRRGGQVSGGGAWQDLMG